MLRFCTRAVVVLALLAAVFGLVLFLVPFNIPWLNERLTQAFREATGLELQSAGAHVRLSNNEVVIERPVVRDPLSPGPPLEMASVTVEMSFLQFLTDEPPYRIDSIELAGPFSIGLESGPEGIRLAEPYAGLVERLRERSGATSPTQAARVGIGRVGLSPVELSLALQRATGERGEVRLQQGEIELAFENSASLRGLFVTGVFNGRPDRPGGEPGFQLWLRPGESGDLNGSLKLADFDSERDLPYPVPVSFAARGVDLHIESQLTSPSLRRLHSMARLQGLTLRDPETHQPTELSDVQIEADALLDTARRALAIEPLRVASRDLATTLSGQIALDWPHAYQLSVRPLDLRGSGLMILAEQLGQEHKVEGSDAARVTLAADVAGDFSDPHPTSVLGTLALAGVNWTQDVLPMPLLGLEAEARLTTTGLELLHSAATLNGVPLSIKGRVLGDVFRRQIDAIAFDWETRGEIENMASIARGLSIPQADALKASGRLRAEGSVALSDPFRGTLSQALSSARYTGELRFREAGVEHPALPAPLRELRGILRFDTNVAELVNISGRLGGIQLELGGKIKGDRQFWRTPVFELTPRLHGGAVELANLVYAARGQSPAANTLLPVLGGTVDARLNVALDPRDWTHVGLTGSLALDDVATSISTPYVNGPAVVNRLDFRCTTDTLTIESLQGKLGEIAFDLGAKLSPSQADLTLKVQADLAEVKQRIPPALRFFRAAGPASASHRTTLRPRPGSTPPRDWSDWLAMLGDPARRPAQGQGWWKWLNTEWELKNEGTLELHGAELTWISMPASLDQAHGMARYDDTHLWTPEPLRLRAGEGSSEVEGTLELRYDLAREPFSFSFAINKGHFNLEPWLKPWDFPEGFWRPGEHREDWPDDLVYEPQQTPTFVLNGTMETETVEGYHLHGRDFSGRIKLLAYNMGQPGYFTWSNVRARSYDGDLYSSGTLFNSRLDVHARARNVSIAPLTTDLRQKSTDDAKYSGQLTTALTGGMRFGQEPPETFYATGDLTIEKSRFVSSKILNSLGGLLKLPGFEDMSFSTIRGPYQLHGEVFHADGIAFDNPIANMRATGKIGPEKALDLVLKVEFLQIAGRVPVLSSALDVFNKLAGKLLQVRVGGTVDEPSVRLL